MRSLLRNVGIVLSFTHAVPEGENYLREQIPPNLNPVAPGALPSKLSTFRSWNHLIFGASMPLKIVTQQTAVAEMACPEKLLNPRRKNLG